MSDIETKMVFGISPQGQGDGIPVVLLGIPKGAWEFMKDGKTHHFDLTRLGVPVKMMLYGAKDHTEAMRVIEQCAAAQGEPLLDDRRTDYGIPMKEENLLELIKEQHRALDWLLARMIILDPTFMPSKSYVWPTVEKAAAVIREAG